MNLSQEKLNKLIEIYESYIKEACQPTDIRRWSAKKTVTKAILNCAKNPEARLNERKVYEAVKNVPGLQEGDKVYLYPCILTSHTETTTLKNGKIKEKVTKTTGLKLADNWKQDQDNDKLIERVVDTMDIFANVINTEKFIDYSLVKNKKLLTFILE